MFILWEHQNASHLGVQTVLSRIREKCWVLGGRRTVHSALSHGVLCKRFNAKPFQTKTPTLPVDRVHDAGVFEIVGIELAGPLYLKHDENSWGCLFTCTVYRAVHLELVTSMSTRDFLLAFR